MKQDTCATQYGSFTSLWFWCFCRSFEAFIDAVREINANPSKEPEHFDLTLATVGTTFLTTAILEAGRLSLDNNSRPYDILYELKDDPHIPSGLKASAS